MQGGSHIGRKPLGQEEAAGRDGYRVAAAVVASGATAALAYNDLVAVGLVEGLREAGVRVPQDVSVTGFDDIPFARYVTPSLTTASVPVELLAYHVAVQKGTDVDQPRNLAKSVTVE